MCPSADTGDEAAPLFSVIIPLEYHRGRWEDCLQGWLSQSLEHSRYEMVLVTPTGLEDRANLAASLAAQAGIVCRVVVSDLSHDIGSFSIGAEHARGQYLFFTESHCWPQGDVLTLCARAFDDHLDWAGFSCRSLPITANRLAEAEAKMYDADIAHGMTVHPWRKILDQCFATRRDAYIQCGGFRAEFGHFSEWALAANYHELGLLVGYLPEACFYHQYLGELSELRRFTLDFVQGEIRYLNEPSGEPGARLIETPGEWISQGNLRRPLARALFKGALRDASHEASHSSRKAHLATATRWLAPAIFGDRLIRATATVNVTRSRVRLQLASLLRSSQRLNESFRAYLAAVIHHQRLSCIASARKTIAWAKQQSNPNAASCDIFAPHHAGLHPIEEFQGTRFRWSEPAAMVLFNAPAEKGKICINCLPVRPLPTVTALRLRLDGREIPNANVCAEPSRIIITCRDFAAGSHTLGWSCSRFPVGNDSRKLGLPITTIELTAT